MNKRLLETNTERSKEINKHVKSLWERMSDIGSKLLTNRELTLTNIEELAKRIAERQNYEPRQLIVCNEITLSQESDLHKSKINDEPIFIIFRNEQKSLATFCIVERQKTLTCLIKNFSCDQILETIENVVKEVFGKNVEFKVHPKVKNNGNSTDNDILCLKTLETMMVHLKPDKKERFIENFDNLKESYFEWLKNGCLNLKNELFSLVKEGYYATTASDIDKLSSDTKFKEEIKKLINEIPLPEVVEPFKNYQTLLKEFTERVDNGDDIDTGEMEQLRTELDRAGKSAFSKVEGTKFFKNRKSDQQLDVVKNFPDQMERFTRIFEPLVFTKVDEAKFDEELEVICKKLDLEYEKLKIFFNSNKIEEKLDNDNTTSSIIKIDDVINKLPMPMVEDANQNTMNKTIEQLFAEIIVENLDTMNVESLIKSYMEVKYFNKVWSSVDAETINEWAVSKRGKLATPEIYKAVAILDRANELVTGGHKLRDTQILSVIAFLQQTDKGQLLQIQTGEGKTTIISVLAAIKALQGKKVDVITSNPVLAADAIKVKQLFYNLLNLTVETNNLDENYKSGPRDCYKADVVYGNISNFQFDYLEDTFLGLNTRAERPFESIILDEVDSMIIDNASHIAKLSEHLPGMENLKYIYIKIWQELHKAEHKITREFGEQLKLRAEEVEQFPPSGDSNQSLCESLLRELKGLIIPELQKSIEQVEPTKIDIIPSHIQKFADTSLDRWINSAINAKFIYHEDEQYVIRVKNNEKVIQPVDYANTGVTLKNTMWQHGLHQFLQLKHNLHLTSESLTSCFISNLCYINKYGCQIFGLTGTLGSEAEQKLLSSIYNVELANIPTYKKKEFIELESKIVDDGTFIMDIAENVIAKIKHDRAVLIICETIKDAKAIQEFLSESNVTIKTFFDEDHAYVTEEYVDLGDVVIATNIAGRGTDFKTSAILESNKGLHVCVTFLPCNKRVEDQAFGRTARQGNHGSGQLVIKKSVIDNLDINSGFFEEIKNVRDEKERIRLKLIQDIKIPELKFQDKLFEQFSTLYKNLQEKFECKRELKFVLDDLKEFWAFWLNRMNFEDLNITNKILDVDDVQSKVDQVFQDFQSEAAQVINGEIMFNPYYSILQAEFFISSNNKLEEAENSLKHALEISKNPEILHSAYMKLFEISIEKGGIFIEKFKEAVRDVFCIPESFCKFDLEYKQNAKKYLKKAREAFKKELSYISNLFEDKEFSSILTSDINIDPNQPRQENLLLKHIVSKQQALSLIMNHVNNLICQIDELKNGLSIGSRIPDYLSNLEPKHDHEKKIKNSVTSSELAELAANGSNITYALREVHNVCPEIVKAAKVQIRGGIGLIIAGFIFPPALFIASSIGATMITEGVCDIALELINKNSDGKFNVKAFIKGKVISYGISLFTIGVCAALQCPKILEKAKIACRWFAETLRKCPCLKNACEFLASKFDKLADWFEKMEHIAKFNSMTKMDKLKYAESLDSKCLKYVENLYEDLLNELKDFGALREITHFENCISTLEQVTNNIGSNVTRTVENAIMKKIRDSSISEFKFKFQNNINSKRTESVKKHHDENIPDVTEVIKNKINEFLVSMVYKFMKQLFKDIFNSIKEEILIALFGILVFWLLFTFC